MTSCAAIWPTLRTRRFECGELADLHFGGGEFFKRDRRSLHPFHLPFAGNAMRGGQGVRNGGGYVAVIISVSDGRPVAWLGTIGIRTDRLKFGRGFGFGRF